MTGVILIFYNIGKKINLSAYAQFLSTNSKAYLCLINNGSTDNTSDVLHKLEESYPKQISVVDLKSKKEKDFALRIGFRLLVSLKVDSLSFDL